MKPRGPVVEIALWEIRRWFKLKDQALTIAIALGSGALFWGGALLLSPDLTSPVTLRVHGGEALELPVETGTRLRFEPARPEELDSLRTEAARGGIAGLLVVRGSDAAELVVAARPAWLPELERLLADSRRSVKTRAMGVTPEAVADLSTPPRLTVAVAGGRSGEAETPETVIAIAAVVLMILGVFNGVGYQFVSITGEKQLRVTEVMLAAATPQQWIDGKILGTSVLALLATAVYAAAGLLFVLVSLPFGSGWGAYLSTLDPGLAALLLAIAAAGYLFWCTLFGAVAATINDPNTSTRSSLVMLPALPAALAVLAVFQPDSTVVRILSIFPITAPGVLPARLVLAEVPWWESALAIMALLAGAAAMRRAAGRIFRLGMLLHGKEPTIAELRRWARSD